MEDDADAKQIFCPRCQSSVRKLPRDIESDLGLAIAALIVFFPAMLLPIMSFQLGESAQTDTMLSALYYFYYDGYPVLSVLVFFTSVFAPFVQIIVSILMFSSLIRKKKPRWMKFYFKTLIRIRHWAMLDVYIIAILVSTVKLSATAEVVFGPGMVMFVSLLIFTFMLGSSFNSRQIWRAFHHAY